MKIKMITLYAGPDGVMEAGHIYYVSSELGQQLVTGHYALILVDDPAPAAIPPSPSPIRERGDDGIETADVPVEPIEKAVKPRAKK